MITNSVVNRAGLILTKTNQLLHYLLYSYSHLHRNSVGKTTQATSPMGQHRMELSGTVHPTLDKGWKASLTCELHTDISAHPTGAETHPDPPGTRHWEGTSSGSQQETTAEAIGPPWQQGTGMGCIPDSPSWYGIHPSQQVPGLDGAGQQPPAPAVEQETPALLMCHLHPKGHRWANLPNALPGYL